MWREHSGWDEPVNVLTNDGRRKHGAVPPNADLASRNEMIWRLSGALAAYRADAHLDGRWCGSRRIAAIGIDQDANNGTRHSTSARIPARPWMIRIIKFPSSSLAN